ncbi:RNA-guided endonuclease InsQ/TnpB family protein [Nostoc sp.]|uniref:RNA-guided endonuclease InsQ/TnpB family protein n=1 Tax=Nostoc sp. TaxID=1180 RepID=UPI002FF960DF
MIVLEAKLKGKAVQFKALDEALRTAQFIRNSCLRYWMENIGVSRNDLYKYCKILADNPDFPWAKKLNSQARQAHAERAWSAIARFFDNCKKQVPGKKGYPKFKKHQTRASVEYKLTGWNLSSDRKYITFTDKFGAGRFKMMGTRDLNFYQIEQINRVRVVRRSDGYYAQFLINVERTVEREPTKRTVGLDMGLNHFYTDSDGNTVENPRYLQKAQKRLKRVQRRASKKVKGSKNRRKAVNRLGRAHLKVQRQRQDFAVKAARCVVRSNDLVVLEDLQICNLVSQRGGRVPRLEATGEPVRVKNHHLAKSIHDAAWGDFRRWVEYFGKVYGVVTVAVAPQYTSQNCSNCGETVKKSLSTRTHICPHCGYVQDRDHNAAINILKKGLNTVGHTGIKAWGENDLYLNQVTGSDKLAR